MCANSDGFALNVGKEDWQRERVSDCYLAAFESGGSSFKLFTSFDMTCVICFNTGVYSIWSR